MVLSKGMADVLLLRAAMLDGDFYMEMDGL
jgi:hypothetical protein